MRSNNIYFTTVFALALCAFTCGSASADFPTNFFNFTGWDNALVTSVAGQDFLNIAPGVNLNVKVTLAPGASPTGVSLNGKTIGDGHVTNSGEPNTFLFTFSQPLQLVTQFLTVDSQENITISGDGPESFAHVFGAMPTVTPLGNGLSITGNGVGISPTGASNGQVLTGPTSTLTITHTPLGSFSNKFEYYMIGVLVPEPASMSMVGIGLIGALSIFRRRR